MISPPAGGALVYWHRGMAQILDGKLLARKIGEEIRDTLTGSKKKLRLAIVVVGEDPVVRAFIQKKQKEAAALGIDTRVFPFEVHITTNELRKRLSVIVHEKKNSGVIIQLPLPPHINTQYILNSIPPEKDVDMLSARAIGNFTVGKSTVMPPVVGAIRAFFEEYGISYREKKIVIVGAGNLVGRPVALWLARERIPFSLIEKDTPAPEKILREADIIISGVGIPGLITGDKVKEGVVVIDAGTSESGGKVVGDVDFDSVSKKASYITPVPGGVGPVAVAMLFKNLVTLELGIRN